MANFSGLILTDAGRNILSQALTGEAITFTRVALGDGDAPQDATALRALVNERRNAPIQSFSVLGDGTSRIRSIVTNVGLTTGFFAREVGVFATDPDTGLDVLYSYANAGTQADYIPADGGATIIEQLFDLITVVDTAENVTAVIDSSILYATKDELTGVALEGDKLVFPGSSNDYLITNFSSFATYSASTTVGTATVSGDTVNLAIDAGTPAGGVDFTVTRDGIQYVFRVAVQEQTVGTPTIENPVDGVSNIGSGVTLTTSAFLTYPEGADSHASTDWQVATDSGFTAIVFESLDDASNLEAISVPNGTFDESTTYYARARHTGATLGDSAYSAIVSFTTKDAFSPGVEVAKLVASDATTYDQFGYSAAVSGNYAIVGSPGDDGDGSTSSSGSAYIYERSGIGDWVQTQKLEASDAATGDNFGWSVAISGNYAIVGARYDDDDGLQSGSAYIFERDGVGNWSQVAKLTASDGAAGDNFGHSVAIDGSFAIVGAPYRNQPTDDEGAAYVFERTVAGAWLQVAKLLPSDPAANDYFGWSVGISGDYAIVGMSAGSASGSAYVYERSGSGVWSQASRLAQPSPFNNDKFGESVSISGDYAVCGATNGTSAAGTTGLAYFFERDSLTGNWVQVAALAADDSASSDRFGYATSISGIFAIVGAYLHDESGSQSGTVYIFERSSGGGWSQSVKVNASDGAAGDYFGFSVGVSGSFAIAGAYRDAPSGTESGSAYILE